MARTDAATMFGEHRETLERAVAASRTRTYYSGYDENPSPRVYGEGAAEDGRAAFAALLGADFPVATPGATGSVATEKSPFGLPLGVSYPRTTPAGVDTLLEAAHRGMADWRDAGIEARVGVGLEILHRLHRRVFELANAVMHTSGQAFVMAFQAGGANALDRALEAIGYAYEEMTRVPATAVWEKPAPKPDRPPLRLEKTFTVVPRGVSLLIGCNTFPTWNSYPGLFASLVCGNPVVVKPHPGAVLPLAITVQVCREVLAEAGFDEDLVTLAAEDPADGLAQTLATHAAVRLVDFTGSTAFGTWLEEHATQAVVFTEKSGVNSVLVDSTDSFAGMCANLAFSFALYTGQMCTTPQNVYLPAAGIETDEGTKTAADVAAGIEQAWGRLLGEDARAVELLGGVVNDGVLHRLEQAGSGPGQVLVASREVAHPEYDRATVRTPTVVGLTAADAETYEQECFGPVSYLIETASSEESVALFGATMRRHGAMTASVYSTAEGVLAATRRAALDAGVALSENLTGQVFVNQSAAFSDFHGTGANPAANSTYTDGAYVAPRFRMVQSRRHG